MSTDLSLSIPLVKLDVERRLVIGRAAQEMPDKSKEIMDYESAKPAFQKWSDDFSAASNGLSKGNLRVMHGKQVAGKLVDLSFNDREKAIDVIAHVVDDNEWQKCLSGCYTGFSVGGAYLRKWTDPDTGMTRYTPDVRELSLVDNPCIPSAKFAELVKADHVVGRLELRGAPPGFAQAWAARPPTYAALAKFDEARHRRGAHGRFAPEGGAAASATTDAPPATAEAPKTIAPKTLRGHVTEAFGALSGAAGGAAATASLGGWAEKKLRRPLDPRDQAARFLRRTPKAREDVKGMAASARKQAAGGVSGDDMARAAYAKVMQEAAARGDDMDQAHARASAWSDKVRGRSGRAADWHAGQAAASRMFGQSKAALRDAAEHGRLPDALLSHHPYVLGAAAAAGAGLGFLSGRRDDRVRRGHDEPASRWHRGAAIAGRLLRVQGHMAAGGMAAGVAAAHLLPRTNLPSELHPLVQTHAMQAGSAVAARVLRPWRRKKVAAAPAAHGRDDGA